MTAPQWQPYSASEGQVAAGETPGAGACEGQAQGTGGDTSPEHTSASPAHARADSSAALECRSVTLRRVFGSYTLPAAVLAGVPSLRPDRSTWAPLGDTETLRDLVAATGHAGALAVLDAALALRLLAVRREGESREACDARWAEGHRALLAAVEQAWGAL